MMQKQSKQKRAQGQSVARSLGQGDVIVKRMTIPNGTVSSSAGSIIVVTTFSAALVQSNPATEWSSFAARYQQFRVRRMRLHLIAAFNVSEAAVENGNAMYYSDWIGASVPSSAAQVLADEGAVVRSSFKDHTLSATWVRNPNAKLWNPTNAALPVANSFGVALCSGTAGQFLASTVIFTYALEFEVEFRGSQ